MPVAAGSEVRVGGVRERSRDTAATQLAQGPAQPKLQRRIVRQCGGYTKAFRTIQGVGG